MTFLQFARLLFSSPALRLATALTLGVVFVNGWTDAPNAVATCVASRAIKPRAAVLMAAACNFLGALVMTLLAPKVTETIYNIADFGPDTQAALVALCAALFSIVVWAVLAWAFGIPTSESHALIAGLTGSAIAMHGGLKGVNGGEWAKVLLGLAFSLAEGFCLGYAAAKLLRRLFRNADSRRANDFFRRGQLAAAAGTAFMHGAQDGQKFMGVFLLGSFLAQGSASVGEVGVPVWLMLLCSLTMAAGTSIGGLRIIKSVGMDMARLKGYQGFAADIAATAGLLVCSATGMPVSTTHAKTAAVMGAGAAGRPGSVNYGVVKNMLLTWALTFPGCGLIGFLITKLFVFLF